VTDSWYFDSCSRDWRSDVWNTVCFPIQDKNIEQLQWNSLPYF